MPPIIPIAVTVVTDSGRILLVRRTKPPFVGLLSIPGGKIEFGESIGQTAERELLEETGIKAGFDRHIGFVSEHITEAGAITAHLLIHMCAMKVLSSGNPGEMDPVWIDLRALDERKREITPSDYHMIKEIVLARKARAFHSVIEKSGNSYIQREFSEI
jgi:ADP-ribose pyrophosphatase YjhB (NUDIX family)